MTLCRNRKVYRFLTLLKYVIHFAQVGLTNHFKLLIEHLKSLS